MIAHTAWPIMVSIWILSLALIVLSFYISWTYKQQLELRERVHELERERNLYGYR